MWLNEVFLRFLARMKPTVVIKIAQVFGKRSYGEWPKEEYVHHIDKCQWCYLPLENRYK